MNHLPDFPVQVPTGAAIQTAIDEAAKAGGGRVVVPATTIPCGSLRLRSHVELHFEKGAVLLGGTKPEDYASFPKDVCAIAPEGSYKVFLYAYDEEDIAITGEGTIDGQGPSFFDKPYDPPFGQFWPKPPIERPRMVQFIRCKGVRLEGATFKDSPCWTMLIRQCENVFVDGITVTADQRMINNDGIDFDGCRHVRVTRSHFHTGDDCIILRAMREADNDEKILSEDFEATDCVLESACQTIRIGCPSDDEIRDARFRNIRAKGRNGIFFDYPVRYLRPSDEGFVDVHGLTFEHYDCEATESALQIVVEPGVKVRSIRDIVFRDFRVRSARSLRFVGNAFSPIHNVLLENVQAHVDAEPWLLGAETDGLRCRNVEWTTPTDHGTIADEVLATPPGSSAPLVRSNTQSWETKKQTKANE